MTTRSRRKSSTGTGTLDPLLRPWQPAAVPTETDQPLPDAVIEEVTEDPTLDDWVPDFPVVRSNHERVDSRRWLLLPERYTVKPLRAMEAARAADELATAPHGRAMVAAAARLRAQRQGLAELLRSDPEIRAAGIEDDDLEALVDQRMRDHAQVALEELIGEARISPYAWALGWLERCQAFRVPLPSRQDGPDRDPGGLVHACKGAGEWTTYYRGRETHVLRLGAACAWASLGPFFVDLR
jgi:hypothetical protein